MPSVLITGAGRGLGLEFVRQYAAEGWNVLACCRNPAAAAELSQLAAPPGASITIHALDVARPEQIGALAAELATGSLDLLINNAGVYPVRADLGTLVYDAWVEGTEVNTLGPVRMTEALLGPLSRGDGAKVVNITSKMGSIADNSSGGSYGYRASKAALNMASVCLAHDLRPRGIVVLILHPGWVETDMGGAGAPVSVEESVGGMRRVIAESSLEDSGKFLAFDGEEVPW